MSTLQARPTTGRRHRLPRADASIGAKGGLFCLCFENQTSGKKISYYTRTERANKGSSCAN